MKVFSPIAFPYFGSAVTALAWSWLLIVLINKFVTDDRAKHRAVRKFGDDLFRLFVDAAESHKGQGPFAVMLTLDDRKVYVGFVLKCPLEFHEAYVKILRIASGYRDPEKLAVTFTHNYIELWLTGKVSEEMFIAYLPVKAIKSAHRFDPGVYTEFFSGGSREKSTASDSPPTPQQSPPQA